MLQHVGQTLNSHARQICVYTHPPDSFERLNVHARGDYVSGRGEGDTRMFCAVMSWLA